MSVSLTWGKRILFALISLIAGVGIVMLANIAGSFYIELSVQPGAEPSRIEYAEGILVGFLVYIAVLIGPVLYISKAQLPYSIGQSLSRIFIAFVVGGTTIDLMLGTLTKEDSIIPWRLNVTLLILAAALIVYQVLIARHSYRDKTKKVPTRSFIRRHVLEDEYELRYDGLDEMGFGQATNPKTGEEYQLNKETIGYHPQDLKKGQRFAARITRAHYVVEITEILDAPYLY